jgi:hypothetical protein
VRSDFLLFTFRLVSDLGFPNFSKPHALPDKASQLDLTNLSNPVFLRDCANCSVF